MNKPLVLAFSRQAGGAEKSAIKVFHGLGSLEDFDPFFGTLIRSSNDFYQIKTSSKILRFLPFYNFFIASGIPFRWLWLPIVAPFDILHFRILIKINRIDTVVSFGAGVGCFAFLFLLGSKVKQVTSERIDPNPNVYRPSMLSRLMRPYIYRRGVICSVQTIGVSDWVKANWNIEAILTPNHFEIPTKRYLNLNPEGPVVAVGRPAFQKGYDLLFSAWKHVEEIESRELWIVCDDRLGFVQELISQSGCENIRIKPLTDDLHILFDKASLFISTARFEGYPNAIAEAMIYGLPVLATISSDVVADWAEAQLCVAINDVAPEVLGEQILCLIQDKEMLQNVSNNAVSNRALFDWEVVKGAWLSALT
jgi:GalNAc-alpha-(1->4)-GalNAc-alpha-(1->3)-diNAcBac-PP-undecaprenol alpha-1,4-N-acetyl-D-galactosaminyltransferase